MDVNLLNNVAATTYQTKTESPKTKSNEKTEVKDKNEEAAVYEKSDESNTAKKSHKPDRKAVNRMRAETESKMSSFANLVGKLFNKQGMTFDDSISFLKDAVKSGQKFDPEVVKKAQEDVADDGYFGVEKTSERILGFAKALAGSDPKQAEKLRKAVEKGFKEAEKQWGGELPEICQKTYDKVMEGFDKWSEDSDK